MGESRKARVFIALLIATLPLNTRTENLECQRPVSFDRLDETGNRIDSGQRRVASSDVIAHCANRAVANASQPRTRKYRKIRR
jgi:hypothetical protein